jgi:hypothetical protein
MTTRARMLALIDTYKDEPPLIREIAARVVFGFEEEDAFFENDMEDEDAALVDALHRQWPEATDEEITRGFNLAVAVAETVKQH